MKTPTNRSETRDGILRAAGRLLIRTGGANLTLEAVAREAGISKGGLLYHFPNKDALIESMLRRQVEQFEAHMERVVQEDDGPPHGKWVRAFVRATFEADPEENNVLVGLLAALATNPRLLDPLRLAFGRWEERMRADGIHPTVATIIRLASDGLLFADFFGLNPPVGGDREAIMESLLRLTTDETTEDR